MLKKRDGFTLVELIVALGLAALIMVAGMFAVQYFSNMHTKAGSLSQAQQLAQSQIDLLETELRYAYKASISDTVPDKLEKNYACLFVQDGKVLRRDPGHTGAMLSDAGFADYTYSLSFSFEAKKVLKTEIRIYFKGDELFRTHISLHLPNLTEGGEVSTAPGKCIVYNKEYVPVKSVVINNPLPIIGGGSNLQMSASVYPITASNKGVAWSADPSEAEIDANGVLTPLKKNITLTATAKDGSGVSAVKVVQINGFTPITKLTLNRGTNRWETSTDIVKRGDYLMLNLTFVPSNATNKKVVWSVSPAVPGITINAETNKLTIADYVTSQNIYVKATTTDGSNISSGRTITVN